MTDEEIKRLQALGSLTCLDRNSKEIPLLTPGELEAITVQKGTLTDRERDIMQQHVVHTVRMLQRMRLEGEYSEVPAWAGAHHEYLDGSGYPDHLTADSLPPEARLLTIIDIYDALTAEDRPYKKPMLPENAFAVLKQMRDEGKVDGDILALFEESGVWKRE